jgi:hypothetical protein
MRGLNQPVRQQGFVLMLMVVGVVIVASLWLSTKHQGLISLFKDEQIEQDLVELKKVKQRLLAFAVLQPEIYLTDTGGVMQDNTQVPAPGYFPCPDLDGSGSLDATETSCGNPFISGTPGTGFVPDPNSAVGLGSCTGGGSVCSGFVPERISTRNLYFAPAGRYYYVLDERFTFQNPNYVNNGLLRYAPLNMTGFDPADADAQNDPVLSLNGEGGYIALIIDAGTDGLASVNNDGDAHFVSQVDFMSDADTADKIVGIRYNEWAVLVAHRVCAERGRFLGTDGSGDYADVGENTRHWYNAYDETANPGGANWRAWGVACP